MRKVIGGVVYDMEKAELLHDDSNGYSKNDFRWCFEELYRTKKGRYFLAGEGGPMTKYAQAYGDMSGSGMGIIPMTQAEALAWLENHDGEAVILEHFADQVEEA